MKSHLHFRLSLLLRRHSHHHHHAFTSAPRCSSHARHISFSAETIYPSSDPEFIQFPSRRSVVHSTQGIVACTQPLAARAGQKILLNGGNAADAAVAVAAALTMAEPAKTSVGGDMFCLFYEAKTKKVHALNGSGRSAANLSLKRLRSELNIAPNHAGKIPLQSAFSVTVPGAPAGWVDTVERFGSGKLSLEQILAPAIQMGEEGFPVSELSALFWKKQESMLQHASPNFVELMRRDPRAEPFYRAPRPGEIFKNPSLAGVFRALATEGKKGFYTGRVAESIVEVIQLLGGSLDLEDLKYHMETGSQVAEPISLKFNGQNISNVSPSFTDGEVDPSQGVEIWEHPPNGQGLVALMVLGMLEELEKTQQIPTFSRKDHNTSIYLHAVIECLRIAFADGSWWITDPDPQFSRIQPTDLISPAYLVDRATLFSKHKASEPLSYGNPHNLPSPAHNHSDTVYFSVTDRWGNGMSFINSAYEDFGSGIIPKGCGFPLQNRGCNFALGPADHPNLYAPRKRPYHTIIPALITTGGDGPGGNNRRLHTVYGVMGGFMQPQGHVQVLLNMLVFGMNPQQALDAPRICVGAGMPSAGTVMDMTVLVEEGIPEEAIRGLRELGHQIKVVSSWKRGLFGRGQIIRCHEDEGQLVYSAGSDPRGDGCAIPV